MYLYLLSKNWNLCIRAITIQSGREKSYQNSSNPNQSPNVWFHRRIRLVKIIVMINLSFLTDQTSYFETHRIFEQRYEKCISQNRFSLL